MAEQSGKTGITIDCKSLDKRPGIVKTRSSILILYVARTGGVIKDKSRRGSQFLIRAMTVDICPHTTWLFLCITEMLQKSIPLLTCGFYGNFVKRKNPKVILKRLDKSLLLVRLYKN